MDIIIVKYLHILASTFLFGTGVGTAFYLFFISLSRDVHAIAVVARHVVIADWLFTATTIVFQPLSGLYLAHRLGIPLDTPWLRWSILLYLLATACWLPVVWLQMRMRDLAIAADREGRPLPPAYQRRFVVWILLGFPALFAFLAIFYLMTAKWAAFGLVA